MPNERKLDDFIQGYLDYTASSEAPRIFREWVAISTVASAMERKCWLDLGLETFYPNLYVILVGPSGSRKGTAMKPAKSIMDEVGLNIAPETTTKEALAKRLASAFQMEDQNQSDVGMDFIQHSSMTIYNEELAVLFKHNDPDLIMWLTNWHDCQDTWKRETKTQGTNQIEGVWVNLLGAMTPELVKAYMPETALGGGLTGRIIFIYAGEKGQTNPLPFMEKEEEALENDLVHDLEEINALRGEYRLAESFIDPWVEWVYEQEKTQTFQEPNLDPYVNRRRSHLLKLCMIVRASRGDKKVLTEKTFDHARDILTRAERQMPRVFSGVGTSRSARLLSDIAEYIGNQERITRETLVQRFYKEIEDSEHLDSLLEVLKDMDFIAEKANIDEGTVTYVVNSETDMTHLINGSA